MTMSPAEMTALIDRHFWLIMIVAVALNGIVFWIWFRENKTRDPSLLRGDLWLIVGFCLSLIIPWLPIGAGMSIDERLSVWSLFRPQDLNPFVLAFFVLMFAEAFAFTAWVWAGGGARFLVRHLGVFGPLPLMGSGSWRITERAARIFAVALPLFYALWNALVVLTG